MQSDKEVRLRLKEIRANFDAGRISKEQKLALQQEVFAARNAAREETRFQGTQTTLPAPMTGIWEPKPVASVNPKLELLFQLVGVVCLILKTPVRDPETGAPRVQVLPAVEQDKSPRTGWRGGARLPANHHVLFAIMPKRPPEGVKVPSDVTLVDIARLFGVHKTKRELYNPARAERPIVAVFERAQQLMSRGWLCAILRTPESDNLDELGQRAALADRLSELPIAEDIRKRIDKGGNTPKSGWGPKHQTLVWPDGVVLSEPERALFGLHDNASGHRAARKLVKERAECDEVTQMCRELKASSLDMVMQDIFLPLPSEDGLIDYTIKLAGVLRMGDNFVRELTHSEAPKPNLKDGQGNEVPGSGARLTAERIALETTLGPNGIMVPHAVTYMCPDSNEEVTVNRTEIIKESAERDDLPEDFDDLDESEQIDVFEKIHQSLAPKEREPRQRYAVTHTRKGSTSGPWMKAQQDRDTWGAYTRSQNL